MKKFLMAAVFLAAVCILSPAAVKAQHTTYSPPWNPPGPDITQAIIEKNMMRDRLRRNAKKGRKAAPRARKKKAVRRKARRASANVISGFEFVVRPPRERQVA